MKRHATTAALALTASTVFGGTSPTAVYERVPSPAMSAVDMSPDGRFIVGAIDADGDLTADGTYRWDRWTGEFLTLPSDGLGAAAVSDDGTVVLGDMPDPADPDPINGVVAGMWTQAGGSWQSLGYLPNALECPSRSNGYELNSDGTVAVGLSWDGCSGRGYVWDAVNGMQELAVLGSGGNRASVVSGDGTVIAGFAHGTFSRTPAMWDGTTLLGELLDPTGDLQGEFTGISDDGVTLLGTMYTGAPDGSYDAVRWTRTGGLEVIGPGSVLSGWAGWAADIADDGTVIGFDYLLGNRRAWIQPQGQGDFQVLNTWAPAHGASIGDDDLIVPTAISSDGRVVCGFGIHPAQWVAWVLTITPPCVADLDGNGALNLDDLDAFVNAFLAGDLLADLDGNGALNLDDLDAFVAAFLAGCP